MSRQDLGEENIRKIQKTGREGESYMVTIPKEIMNKLSWREHQKVVVELDGKTVKITDWSG
ncbi:MAG: AbrB/MazE/SpoVT family DNA-binding domain-containing protein [Candidatus Saccharibacteria bacterium]|nr:AbrB/MazE/SpoVT family DNA-binding domain-containing protein [Candidatus Saccharibacteria bacterium]